MTEAQKQSIIEICKHFFRMIIVPDSLKGIENISLRDVSINPFLITLLRHSNEHVYYAKSLVYPILLSNVIDKALDKDKQAFISQLASISGIASKYEGVDIEFIDAFDGRIKYCQCKIGAGNLSTKEVSTIAGHFIALQDRARQDNIDLYLDDMIVGVLYGEKRELSDQHKDINEKIAHVYCGEEFWEHLTGDKHFYYRLASAFEAVVEENDTDGKHIIIRLIDSISGEIKNSLLQ